MFVSSKKIVLLFAFTALTTGCLEKSKNTAAESPAKQQITDKRWQWDDQRKEWAYNGSLFKRKPEEPSPSVWKNQDNAIVLNVESPKTLTLFDNAPNAVQMKVFQLSDSKAFSQAAKSASGLKHLLVTEQIDPAILAMQRLMVLPGVAQTLTLDRKAGARYIGIVLGYASLEQARIFRLIPLVSVENDNAGDSKISAFLPTAVAADKTQINVAAKETVRAAILRLNLQLKADGIDRLDVDAL